MGTASNVPHNPRRRSHGSCFRPHPRRSTTVSPRACICSRPKHRRQLRGSEVSARRWLPRRINSLGYKPIRRGAGGHQWCMSLTCPPFSPPISWRVEVIEQDAPVTLVTLRPFPHRHPRCLCAASPLPSMSWQPVSVRSSIRNDGAVAAVRARCAPRNFNSHVSAILSTDSKSSAQCRSSPVGYEAFFNALYAGLHRRAARDGLRRCHFRKRKLIGAHRSRGCGG